MKKRFFCLFFVLIILTNTFTVTAAEAISTDFAQGLAERVPGLYIKYKGEGKSPGDVVAYEDVSVILVSQDKKVTAVHDWECENLSTPLVLGENYFTIRYDGYVAKLCVAAKEEAVEEVEVPAEPVRKYSVSVTPIAQNPELPTGCEITSLAVVLNYYGYAADKCTLADYYLDKGPVNSTDFRTAFVGNPRSSHAYGCYAPVIAKSAKKYLFERGSSLVTQEVTGQELETLFDYTAQDIPVIIWGTINCAEGYYTSSWYVGGKKVTWFANEHCMVLTGFDYDKNVVYVADPLLGAIKEYDMAVFKDRYNSLGKQAVVIQPKIYS